MIEPDPEARITVAREDLAAKLGELQRRFDHVHAVLSPRTYLDNPWLRLAFGAALGYALGRITARAGPPLS